MWPDLVRAGLCDCNPLFGEFPSFGRKIAFILSGRGARRPVRAQFPSRTSKLRVFVHKFSHQPGLFHFLVPIRFHVGAAN